MSFGARLDKMLIAWKPRIDISTKDRTNTALNSKNTADFETVFRKFR